MISLTTASKGWMFAVSTPGHCETQVFCNCLQSWEKSLELRNIITLLIQGLCGHEYDRAVIIDLNERVRRFGGGNEGGPVDVGSAPF